MLYLPSSIHAIMLGWWLDKAETKASSASFVWTELANVELNILPACKESPSGRWTSWLTVVILQDDTFPVKNGRVYFLVLQEM